MNAMLRDALRDATTNAIHEFVERLPGLSEGGHAALAGRAGNRRYSLVQAENNTPITQAVAELHGKNEALILVQLCLEDSGLPADAEAPTTAAAASSSSTTPSRRRRKKGSSSSRSGGGDGGSSPPPRSPTKVVPSLSPSVDVCSSGVLGALHKLIEVMGVQNGVRFSHLPPPTTSADGEELAVDGSDHEGEVRLVQPGEPLCVDAISAVTRKLNEHWSLPSLLKTRCLPHAGVVTFEFGSALRALSSKRRGIVDGALSSMRAKHLEQIRLDQEAKDREIRNQIDSANQEGHGGGGGEEQPAAQAARSVEGGNSSPPVPPPPSSLKRQGTSFLQRRDSAHSFLSEHDKAMNGEVGEDGEVIKERERSKEEVELTDGLRSWTKAHHRELERLRKAVNAASTEAFWPMRLIELGLFAIQPTTLLDGLSSRSESGIHGAYEALAADARRRHEHVLGSCEDLLSRIHAMPVDIEAIFAQEEMYDEHLAPRTSLPSSPLLALRTPPLLVHLSPPFPPLSPLPIGTSTSTWISSSFSSSSQPRAACSTISSTTAGRSPMRTLPSPSARAPSRSRY